MRVSITSGGILDSDGNKITNLRYHYGDEVHIEDGLTVLGLFSALECWIPVLETDFISETGGWDIRGFFDQVKSDSDRKTSYRYFSFRWVYESITSNNLETNKLETDLDHYLGVFILGIDGLNYSLMFDGLNNVKDLPIILVSGVNLRNFNTDTGESKDILEFQKGIRLRELISALMDEITFLGDVEGVKKAKIEFDKEMGSFSDLVSLDNLVSFDDMELEMLGYDLDIAISHENYEWAQRIKDKMDLIKERRGI